MSTPPEGPPPGPPSDPYRTPPPGGYGAPPADPYGTPPPPGPYGAPPPGPYGAALPGQYGAAPPGPYGAPPPPDPYGAPAGYGQGPGYGADPSGHPSPPQGPPTDVVSVVGLVLAFLLAPVGLVVSIVGLTRTAGGRRKGRGFAVAGVVVSVLMSLVLVGVVVALVALGSYVEEQVGPGGIEELFTGEPFVTEPLDPSALLPLGRSAEVGDLRLTVTDVDLDADEEVAADDPDAPAAQGRYVLVTGTVDNSSADAQDVYVGLTIAYRSAEGGTYDELTCDAELPGAALDAPVLEPGGSTEVRWCLDVPVDEVGDGGVAATTLFDLSGNDAAVWADR